MLANAQALDAKPVYSFQALFTDVEQKCDIINEEKYFAKLKQLL
jgi:hypothetical protein